MHPVRHLQLRLGPNNGHPNAEDTGKRAAAYFVHPSHKLVAGREQVMFVL